jgi:hypothetical protein
VDSVAIHCEPLIPWQNPLALKMQAGLKILGINAHITNNRQRETDIGILLGTTCWRAVEATGRYLLVDRASIGDPEFVQLVWNGHGRRGDHKVPERRYNRIVTLGVSLHPWCGTGARVVLCGQYESYSPRYPAIEDWYGLIEATHFRKHPAGDNSTGLPLAPDWTDCGQVITLNSSVGVESVINGIPTVTMDESAMAWDVTGHEPGELFSPDRTEWLEWLAWTQWHHDEIAAGIPHIFEDL